MASSKNKKETDYISNLAKSSSSKSKSGSVSKPPKDVKKEEKLRKFNYLEEQEKIKMVTEAYREAIDLMEKGVSAEADAAIKNIECYLGFSGGQSDKKYFVLKFGLRSAQKEFLEAQREYTTQMIKYNAKKTESAIEEKIPVQESPLETAVKKPEVTAPKVKQPKPKKKSLDDLFKSAVAEKGIKDPNYCLVFRREGKSQMISFNDPNKLQIYVQELISVGCEHQIWDKNLVNGNPPYIKRVN